MSYRYSSIDIIVGVGLCAVVFGALLVFFAASGPAIVPQSAFGSPDDATTVAAPSNWLQPALGQAIVERALLQRRTDQLTSVAAAEWSQALRAQHSLQSLGGDPFVFVMHRAEVAPIEHDARVQGVLGRYIVNFTRRGVMSGALAADQYLSDYNSGMIALADSLGRKLNQEFDSTWQPLLGRWIVQAGQDYQARVAGVQEQLGLATVHMVQAKTALEDAWAVNQYQVGSLMAAADREKGESILVASVSKRGTAQIAPSPAARSFTWPEMPIGFMVMAAFGLCAVFLMGLMWSAAAREAKALAEARRHAARWVYRMAA